LNYSRLKIIALIIALGKFIVKDCDLKKLPVLARADASKQKPVSGSFNF